MNNAILQNLAALSEDINEVSDNLSQQIADFETALNKLRLGVTAWVRMYTISSSTPLLFDRHFEIGYGKHNAKWGLLFAEGSDLPLKHRQIQPLREAPRADRHKAVEKLPELVKKLEEESRKVVEDARVKNAQMREILGALRALTQ